MAKICHFGVFIFDRHFTLIYRFLSDDLYNYLYKRHLDRLEDFEKANPAADEIPFSIDDTIALTLSTLLHFYDQTNAGDKPIRRITLDRNIQVFFDSMGENRLLCIADESFDTLIVLKAINLFKSLVRFHLGAFPFTQCETVTKAIDRISAALQYYLNNVMTNQSLIFESSEFLILNGLIRGQCNDACSIINVILQQAPTVILITCKDKIVHMQMNNEQNRPSNSDLFLLLLNNISRTLRESFQVAQSSSAAMAHSYRRRSEHVLSATISTLSVPFSDERRLPFARRTISLPTAVDLASLKLNTQRTVEVIFMKTSNKNLAPFAIYTLPLTDDISVLILIESKHSSACSNISEVIQQLNLWVNQSNSFYKNLSAQMRSLETHAIFKPHLVDRQNPSNSLLKLLNTTHDIYKALTRKGQVVDQEDPRVYQIQNSLADINARTVDIFHHCFFSTEASSDNNIIEPMTIQNLQGRLLSKLGDWFAFIETKSQGNITISFCQQRFPGLVHFALIDRPRGRICTPVLFSEEYKNYLATQSDDHDNEVIKENKIIEFELECLTALQRGCTSYTLTDEYFTYNYTLRLEESNGASMRLYKPFVKSEPPGVLHFDFYEKLAQTNYATLGDQTSISCYELVCVHLRFVPPDVVREHCQQLWSTLRELDD